MKTDPMQDDAMKIFTFKLCAIYGRDMIQRVKIPLYVESVIDFSVTHISSKRKWIR